MNESSQGSGDDLRFVRVAAAMVALAVLALLTGLSPGSGSWAQAAPEELWTKCDKADPAIECSLPRGIAASPDNGHIFLADQSNFRLIELNALGELIRTLGWDVVSAGSPNNRPNNELQQVTINGAPTGGTFTMRFGNVTTQTDPIPFNASAAQLREGLESSSTIGAGDVAVSSANPGGGAAAGGPYTVEFTGALADADVTQLTGQGGGLTPSGSIAVTTSSPGASFEVCVPADGDACKVGTRGDAAGQFNGVHGVALDGAGNLFATDRNNRRVQKFAPDGEFSLMFGGEVNKTSGADLCTKADLEGGDACGAGTTGSEDGQFDGFGVGDFIDIDPAGRVNVGDLERIQRFDAEGAYQDQCSVPGATVQSLAIDDAGSLYVAYSNQPDVRKLSFLAGGECEETLRFELPRTGASETESIPTAVAVDATGHVLAFGPIVEAGGSGAALVDPIHKFAPGGEEVEAWGKEEFRASTGIEANLCAGSEAPGNVYVSNFANGTGPPKSEEAFIRAYGTDPVGCFKARTGEASEVTEFTATLNGTVNPDGGPVAECRFQYGTSESYGQIAPCAQSPAQIGEGDEPVAVHAEIDSLQKGTVHHFRLLAEVGGETETGADAQFKTLGPPVISAEHVAGATDSEATLKALVNPEGFATDYHFEYTTLASFEASGFEGAQSTPQIAVGEDRSEHAVLATLAGLSPGTAYRWRVVATNSSGTSAGQERVLNTFRAGASPGACPNDAVRGAASASLPDCRAYEMVSPVDKNGGDIVALSESYFQARPDGEKITYTTKAAFGDAPSATVNNQYIATRGAGGWSNHAISTPIEGEPVNSVIFGLTREFMAFTPDLCNAWLVDFQEPPPTAEGQLGHPNLYRRDSCGAGEDSLEALAPASQPLPEGTHEFYVGNTSIGGASEDGRHAVFTARAALPHAPQAAAGDHSQVYDRFGGELAVVSVLPDGGSGDPAPGDGRGFAAPVNSAVGSTWTYNLEGAVAADGSRVYWTANSNAVNGRGTIHVRHRPEQGIVEGECSEAGKACTVQVSGTFPAFFWGASADGAKALYSEPNPISGEDDLFVFGEGEPTRKVAAGVRGAVAWSEDLSHIYFVSRKALAGGAAAGEPNLYLDEEGTTRHVATLVEGDVGQIEIGANLPAYNIAEQDPRLRAVRASADGETLAFQSRAELTGFDNSAVGSGKAAVEVYLYEAGAGELECVSCNPAGARPATRELPEIFTGNPAGVPAAAWIPGWGQPLHASHVLSADGGRLFFNSHDPLLARDTNGAQDLYQWERAGVGGCTLEHPSYFPQNGGCLALISSGQSPYESEFWEASAEGDDVFFTTESSLLPQDPGLIDLYNARVGGGYPRAEPRAECEGEACQNPPAPPQPPTPASAQTEGSGNVPAQSSCLAHARRAAALSRRAKRARRAARRSPRRAAAGHTGRAKRLARGARKQSRRAKRCRRAERRAQR